MLFVCLFFILPLPLSIDSEAFLHGVLRLFFYTCVTARHANWIVFMLYVSEPLGMYTGDVNTYYFVWIMFMRHVWIYIDSLMHCWKTFRHATLHTLLWDWRNPLSSHAFFFLFFMLTKSVKHAQKGCMLQRWKQENSVDLTKYVLFTHSRV